MDAKTATKKIRQEPPMMVLKSLQSVFCFGSFVHSLKESQLELLIPTLAMIGDEYLLSPIFCNSNSTRSFLCKFRDDVYAHSWDTKNRHNAPDTVDGIMAMLITSVYVAASYLIVPASSSPAFLSIANTGYEVKGRSHLAAPLLTTPMRSPRRILREDRRRETTRYGPISKVLLCCCGDINPNLSVFTCWWSK